MTAIKKVAVIGAGTMGAGIAGQAANAGCEVLLLDLPSEGGDVNARAQAGIDRILDPANPGVISTQAGSRIRAGNIRDDFEQLSDMDWIAEAILERPDLKKDLYKKLHAVIKPEAIVSSNTSTIPIKILVEDMPSDFRKRFAITHFFNPVRFMPLLELVAGEETDPAIMDTLAAFCDRDLGKSVVECRDTPGFLGNRVGCYAIQCALHTAFDMGLSPQEADAVFGRPMGIPKTGVFGLYDLIGIDLMSDVATSLVSILPQGDAFHAVGDKLPLMETMIADGRRGRKSGSGFYRMSGDQKQVMNLQTGDYEDVQPLSIPVADKAEAGGILHILEAEGKYGDYARAVMFKVLSYAAGLVPEVGETGTSVDDAMKLGYNWIKGPFELIDEIGSDYLIEQLGAAKLPVPEFLGVSSEAGFYAAQGQSLQALNFDGSWSPITRAAGAMRFNDVKKTLISEPQSNDEASLYIVDNVALVEFHSKANALDAGAMHVLSQAIDSVSERSLAGLIVHNDAQHFSCGVNLRAVRKFFESEDWDGLDGFLNDFQQTVHKMAVADFPVVVAPVGLSLGGGFEVVLHGKQVICHANSNMGLVESGVGVIPAGGGCKETLYRWIEKLGDGNKAAWEAFMSLGYGKTASSPVLARDLAMLRENDRFVNNRDRLLSEAIAAVKSGAEQAGFTRAPIPAAGKPVFEAMVKWAEDAQAAGKLMPHDVIVSTQIARILTGGDIAPGTLRSEQDLYDAERRAFRVLVQTPQTQARIIGLLDEGKSVRN